MKSIVVENIKRIIKTQDLKKRAVATRAGLTPQNLSDMLAGRKIIKDTDIVPLANALGVTPNDLFGIDSNDEKRVG